MLLHEKADQAQALLKETGLDCWMTFVKETGIHPDPGVDLVVGTDVTWISAFLFNKDGQRLAVVGRFDVANIKGLGVFGEVLGYDESIRQSLQSVLKRLDPQRIGLNFSTDDPTADGLTHGMWLVLNEILRDTAYAGRLTSAAARQQRLLSRVSRGHSVAQRVGRAAAIAADWR